ncbi:MAG: hypothetical protein AAGF31_02650 [Planctomycetota bacterium]
MAARQDQTLQVALIVFVGLTVVLGGFLVYVNRLKADYRQEAESLKQTNSQEQSKARQLQTENESYRQFMGFGQFDNFEDVQKQYEEDKQTFMNTLPEEDRVYRTVVERFDSEIKRSTDQESQAKQREKELKQRLLATEAEKDAQIKEFQEELKQVKADAAKERVNFNEARDALQKKEQEALAALDRQRKAHEEQIAALNATISDANSQLTKVTRSRQKLLDDRAVEEPSFEIADGRVSWVNQANKTVWINLGSGDALRRQVTFSVYEQSASDAGKADKKASIEVIRMLGDHMAEARITDDDPRNPILPGDWIYSPLWHRGKQIHFALTGVIDLDGDERADLQQAKDLIALNGGVVDATVTDDGTTEGEMTVETRYLVLGEYPSLPSQAALRTSWDEMNREAQNLGVDTITLQEFLNQMGYKPLDRTVVLGAGSRAEDFAPEGRKFRPRTPYANR